MPFTLEETPIPDLRIVKPKRFGDARGYFSELFNASDFAELGLPTQFDQDNAAFSTYGAIRGLHFQAPPHAQGKLVTVFVGHVRDIVVDIRPDSPTYGQSFSLDLKADDPSWLWVPPGFAHGYSVLSPEALFIYKVTGYYNKASEGGLRYNDPTLALDWGLGNDAIVSEKDTELPLWPDFSSPF